MNSLTSLGFPLSFPWSLMRISSSEGAAGRRLRCTFTMERSQNAGTMPGFSSFRQMQQNCTHPPPGRTLSTATLTGNLAHNQGWAIPSFTFHTQLLKLFSHKKGFPARKLLKNNLLWFVMMISFCNILNITCGAYWSLILGFLRWRFL